MNDLRNNSYRTASFQGGWGMPADAAATGDLSAVRRAVRPWRVAGESAARDGSHGRIFRSVRSGDDSASGSRRAARATAHGRGGSSMSSAGRRSSRGAADRIPLDDQGNSAMRGFSSRGSTASRGAHTRRVAGSRTSAGHTEPSTEDRARGRGGAAGSGHAGHAGFMRYATDNKVVQTIYTVTTGPYKYALLLLLIVVVGLSLYFPIRDYYVAYRTSDILARQLELREEYNERLETDVDQLLSTEGIENAARENLGLVMPGEKRIDVVGSVGDGSDVSDAEGDDAANAGDASAGDASGTEGADGSGEDGSGANGNADADADNAASSDGDAADGSGDNADNADASAAVPTTSEELREAEEAVANDAPWYIQLLDTIFFYQGIDGQKVASTGE